MYSKLTLYLSHSSHTTVTLLQALLGKATRNDMITWLGQVIEGNGERGKMFVDAQVEEGEGSTEVEREEGRTRSGGGYRGTQSRASCFWMRAAVGWLEGGVGRMGQSITCAPVYPASHPTALQKAATHRCFVDPTPVRHLHTTP